MANIRDFEPGQQEQRGAITVSRYAEAGTTAAAFSYDHDEFWRFSIPVNATIDDKPADEIWLRLSDAAVASYSEDDLILPIVATELLQMAANSDPDATLPDGRKLTSLQPQDLYRTN